MLTFSYVTSCKHEGEYQAYKNLSVLKIIPFENYRTNNNKDFIPPPHLLKFFLDTPFPQLNLN